MDINDLKLKYNLTQEDFWELNKGTRRRWIVTHDACEKIAAIEK